MAEKRRGVTKKTLDLKKMGLLPIASSIPRITYATDLEQTGAAIMQTIGGNTYKIVLTKAQLVVMIHELEDLYDAFLRLRR